MPACLAARLHLSSCACVCVCEHDGLWELGCSARGGPLNVFVSSSMHPGLVNSLADCMSRAKELVWLADGRWVFAEM